MTFDPESHVQDHVQSQKLAAIYLHDWRSERRHIQVMTIEICDIYI